jgi:uncharacterized hydrophobic protein (TIGR00341 family)
MKYVEVVAHQGSAETVLALAEQVAASDVRLGLVDENNMQSLRLLVDDAQVQKVIDTLQSVLGSQPQARIIVLAVETSLPRSTPRAEKKESNTALRETLYEDVVKNAHFDWNYSVLVMLSTIVAAIGLLEDNIAVLVGAMVIAPLLGPNLALSLGASLGDVKLLKQAGLTLLAGILIALLLSVFIGFFWPMLHSEQLLARSEVSFSSVALALASGAAAALSLTTGLSSVLVGVMVAVALLPPVAAMGIFLGQGNLAAGYGAALLLAVNVVSVNLASKLVFLFKGISPRTWIERERARQAMRVYLATWLVLLMLLTLIIWRSEIVS